MICSLETAHLRLPATMAAPPTAPPDNHDETSTFRLLRQTSPTGLAREELVRLQRVESDRTGRNAAILVADDEDAMRQVLLMMLRTLGYKNLSEAHDGEEALAALRDREFDLLITDMQMPNLDGFGLLKAVKDDPFLRHLPVIVASGMNELDAVARSIQMGAEDFLPKPVNAIILRARVSASLPLFCSIAFCSCDAACCAR